jgi:hypothetical protein
MSGRCEPPEETAPMTHHWIGPADGDVEPWLWDNAWVRGLQHFTPEKMHERGWVYSTPVTTPAEVAALKREVERLLKLQAAVQAVMNAPLPAGKHTTTGGVVFVPLVAWAAVEAALAHKEPGDEG